MAAKRIGFVVIIALQLVFFSGSLSASQLYFAEYNEFSIYSVDVDTAQVTTLYSDTESAPIGLYADSQYIYWANSGDGSVSRADLDGANVVDQLVAGIGDAYDVTASTEYVYSLISSKIYRSGLNGDNAAILFDMLDENVIPYGISVYQDYIYVTAQGLTDEGYIYRSDLDGSNITQLIDLGATQPFGITADSSGLYWTSYNTSVTGSGEISYANFDGSGVLTLVDGLTQPVDVAIDEDSLYWSDFTDGTIQSADLNGSNVETLLDGLNAPAGLSFSQVPEPSTYAVLVGIACLAVCGVSRRTKSMRS
ncbi:DUF5050 domain-containing protein [Cerasicoccus frondis]|uniref:DUF5050 domain-containing protein n=1 Tax=Cerasicoccus frondis TaxID=490090 RepID=UPI002852A58E|nr:DUF5050 domain-containing protein [Cerasicoccus frondis]